MTPAALLRMRDQPRTPAAGLHPANSSTTRAMTRMACESTCCAAFSNCCVCDDKQ